MVKIYISILLAVLFIISFSCKSPTEPPVDNKPENQWELIPELSNISVRYILKFENRLFLSGVVSNKNCKGEIWETDDGDNWTKLRNFDKAIGPMTLHGDTLYCLGDSLFRYIIPLNKWENVCQPLPLTISPQGVSEMIFLKNELFAMQNYTDAPSTHKIHFDGTVDEIFVLGYSYGGARFIKRENVTDWCYVRGRYYSGGFYTFDGNIFTKLRDGLSDKEWLNPPTNSIVIKNDTLFAGFRYPGFIKYLDNNTWKNYTDSLPIFQEHSKWYNTEPTGITFINNRMFVSTHPLGVLEWKKDSGWVQMSKGLHEYGWDNLYYPVVFLESINGILLAAYGDPGFAPWGGVGVYKYNLKKNNKMRLKAN